MSDKKRIHLTITTNETKEFEISESQLTRLLDLLKCNTDNKERSESKHSTRCSYVYDDSKITEMLKSGKSVGFISRSLDIPYQSLSNHIKRYELGSKDMESG